MHMRIARTTDDELSQLQFKQHAAQSHQAPPSNPTLAAELLQKGLETHQVAR